LEGGRGPRNIQLDFCGYTYHDPDSGFLDQDPGFLDPEGGSQKATLLVVVVISSLKIPKALLVRSENFAHTFVLTFPSDLPSQIFHLFSN